MADRTGFSFAVFERELGGIGTIYKANKPHRDIQGNGDTTHHDTTIRNDMA